MLVLVSPVPIRRNRGKPLVILRKREGRRWVSLFVLLSARSIMLSSGRCAVIWLSRTEAEEFVVPADPVRPMVSRIGQGEIVASERLSGPVVVATCSELLLRENDVGSPMLEPDAEERFSLFLRIAKGLSLGARLTGKGVTAQVDGAFSGLPQFSNSGVLAQSGGNSRISLLISAMISSSGP
jgi:hypothetical protein